ncbi:MAG TPA: DUF3467 domain-containing protein [Aggregatilinea sp.]|jgi:hypothetical protein|uniref:DUF3467 domain-containing protein n=1 Tax=Aggregatilinea sp. TaxID=2806333 RepID=UPI002BACBBE0|nr:DUF3467 domain-containing protein [Aggregatilinea sp.]HML21274.1 DUF3467 domain-containing protein [Aggregatilinea sp.]
MTEPSKPPAQGAKRQLNLEIPADLPATYANFAIISHSPWEIFLDFAQILPNVPKARVRSRLVLTPANAKMLLRALQENIARYEQQHGEIVLPARSPSLADQLFRTIRTDSDEPGDAPEGEPENE